MLTMATDGLAHLLIVAISCLVAVCVCRDIPLCEGTTSSITNQALVKCVVFNQFYVVRVQGRSWPTPTLLVPENSTVKIYCTLTDWPWRPYWSIELASDGVTAERQFVDSGGQRTLLNKYGVFELTPIEIAGSPPFSGLLINDTATNNQTEIRCISENDILVTTLVVYGK